MLTLILRTNFADKLTELAYMKPDKEKLDLLLRLVGQKFGCTPRTPTDFAELASDVQHTTGRTIGLSTLKRLWGYVKDQTGTTYSTLSLLSRYAGFNDWDCFCSNATGPTGAGDSAFSSKAIVESKTLAVDSTVEIELGASKRCVMVKTGEPDRFRVVKASNIKLRPGDMLNVAYMAVGRPFFASDCRRGLQSLGTYTGALAEGIRKIDIHGLIEA